MQSLLLGLIGFFLGLFAFDVKSEYAKPPSTSPSTPHTPEELVKRDEPTPINNPTVPSYAVTKVVDGDTIVIDKDGTPTTLRLIGLDTPETTTLRKGVVECFGEEATRYATNILTGARVTIETDPTQDTYDKYGRTLAYVFLEDGTNFNESLIREGYGYEYTYRLPYRYQSAFKTAQEEARAEERGLWQPGICESDANTPSPTPPSQSANVSSATSGTYECSKNTYNCSSFTRQAEAQAAFEACGGAQNDIHKLDSDGDGKVCESLP